MSNYSIGSLVPRHLAGVHPYAPSHLGRFDGLSADEKATIVRMVREGNTSDQITKTLGVSHEAVTYFAEQNGLEVSTGSSGVGDFFGSIFSTVGNEAKGAVSQAGGLAVGIGKQKAEEAKNDWFAKMFGQKAPVQTTVQQPKGPNYLLIGTGIIAAGIGIYAVAKM